MSSLFKNKRGAVLPIRTSGRKQKGGWIKLILGVVAIVVTGLFVTGLYNKWVAPKTDKAGITSSLENIPTGQPGSATVEGSTSTIYTDRPDSASFDYQVIDSANDDALVTAGVGVGALSSFTNDAGEVKSKEWLNPSDSFTNATVTTIPEDTVLSFYGGDTVYYLEPLINRKITIGDKIDLVGATIQSESNMIVTVYDDTGSTALSSASNVTYNDYKITLGQGQEKTIYIKLSNNGADGRYDVKAICTGAEGDNVSSLQIRGSDWSQAIVPTFVDNGQVPTVYADTVAVNQTVEYSLCYVYKADTNDAIKLDEWEDTPLIKASVIAKDEKNPDSDVVMFTFLDGSWKRGSDAKGHFDFYQHDGSQGNVGLTETINSPKGKQLGAMIELD